LVMPERPQYMEPIARQLYQEIGLIEQEHVTHYVSLLDPTENWWKRLVTHEYNECWLYYSFMQQESDPRIKAVWELHLQMELAHLQQASDLLRRYDGREPEQIVGATGLPEPLTFEPNKEFLRGLLATQIDLTTLGAGYVREAHERFEWMQEQVHGGEKPPSEQVIDMHRQEYGDEYRIETEGPHPVESLRAEEGTHDKRADVVVALHERMRGVRRAYAADERRPLKGYAASMATYAAAAGALALAVRAAGRPLPYRPAAADAVLLSVATHKLSRIVAKDAVTSPLRVPFTRYRAPAGAGDLHEDVRTDGGPTRHALGGAGELPFLPRGLGRHGADRWAGARSPCHPVGRYRPDGRHGVGLPPVRLRRRPTLRGVTLTVLPAPAGRSPIVLRTRVAGAAKT
jgi:hypothetical protein